MEKRVGFGPRLAATAIDLLIVGIVGFVAGAAIGGMLGGWIGGVLGGSAGRRGVVRCGWAPPSARCSVRWPPSAGSSSSTA